MSTLQDEQLLNALTALKNGDFSARLPADQDGTTKEIAETFNATMEQLSQLSREVRRIMREIGPEGRFGGQAQVDHLSGTWRELVDDVNHTGALLTGQLRNFSEVCHNLMVAQPTDVVTVPAEGETALLKSTINCLILRYGAHLRKNIPTRIG
jgi:HAMP domain-containing protein